MPAPFKVYQGKPIGPGDVYGSWEVISEPFKKKLKYQHMWHVRCRCQTSGIEKDIIVYNLFNKRTHGPLEVSCRETIKVAVAAITKYPPIFDGDSKLANRWVGIHDKMLRRCNDPDSPAYKDYGGRGIKVCKAWHDLETFLRWVREQPNYAVPKIQIDRRDNNRGYMPSNCRLVTCAINARNKRSTVWITYQGERMCASEFARRYIQGVSIPAVIQYLRTHSPAETVEHYHRKLASKGG